jgi:hypothetical protein
VERSARKLLRIEGDRMSSMCGRNVPASDLDAFAVRHAGHMAREFAEIFEARAEEFLPWCVGTALAGAVVYQGARERAEETAQEREERLPPVWARQLVALASTIGDDQ